MQKQVYEDYKYVMQDTNSLYIGAKYSMEEILENEDIPIKFRLIVERYLYTEADKDTSLESYFYYLANKEIFYKVYKQLKTRLRISIIEEKTNLLGKTKQQYSTRTISLEEFMKMSPEEKEQKGVVIQEVAVSKLAMMTF